MLLQLRIANHRSLYEEQTLSFVATGDEKSERVRHVVGFDEGILPAVAIYGANASGKSNILQGAQFFREAVLESHRRWLPGEGVPLDPFLIGAEPRASRFELDFLLGGVRHRYGFSARVAGIEEEWLFRWPQGRKQTLFERTGEQIEFGRNLAGENEVVRSLMRTDSLFLSAAAQNNHATLSPIFEFFRTIELRMTPGTTLHRDVAFLRATGTQQLTLFEDQRARDKAALLHLLRAADVGITDIRVEELGPATDRAWRQRGPLHIWFQHRGEGDAVAWLPLQVESAGTRTLLEIGARIFPVLRQGTALFVDELEASLHPMLASRILDLFQDPKTNPNGAQLIFTTHDTNLIGTIEASPLRRDQVWFTEKDQGGKTKLYPLSDYKPRKEENLERGYLQGRYGGVPFLGDLQAPESQP